MNNKGIALITAIIFAAVITLVSGSILYLIMKNIRASGEFERYETAKAASEGGLEIALFILNNFEKLDDLEKSDTMDFTFNTIDSCAVDGDKPEDAVAGSLDRYIIGMDKDKEDTNYDACQEDVYKTPWVTYEHDRYERGHYNVQIFMSKENQGAIAGSGMAPTLSASPTGKGEYYYLMKIISVAADSVTAEISTTEALYYLTR